jgi:hypothetical protein
MHQAWVCTTKSAALEGPIFGAGAYMLVPHWSLFGRYLVANSSNQLPMISILTYMAYGGWPFVGVATVSKTSAL